MDLFNKLCGIVQQDDDCDCHKRLKDHLRECADYGKLPPIRCGCPPPKKKDEKCEEICDEQAKEECEKEEEEPQGPPLCTGMMDAPKCCPGQNEFKIKVFVPKPDIPDTFRFECPPPVIYCPPPPCCPTKKKDECECEDECCSNLQPTIVVQRSDGLTCKCSNNKDCGCDAGPSRPPRRNC